MNEQAGRTSACKQSGCCAGLFQREEGASAVEYAILIALIAAAIFATVTLFGVQVLTLFQGVSQAFQ